MTKETEYDRNSGRTVTAGVGLPGKVAVAWSAAGGILVGGFLVAAMTLTGQLSGHALLLTCTGLFVVGAVLGFIHGSVLGWMGRPKDAERKSVLSGLALAAAYAIPALLVSWLVAGWIAMTATALYAGKTGAIIGCGVAWLVGLGLVALAGENGFKALRNAYSGWSNARVATLIVAALLGGLLAVFLAEQPRIWGMELQFTPVGAVLLALAATLWLAGPMVTVSLGLLDRLPTPRPAKAFGGKGNAIVSIAIALVVGVFMALIAMPFYGAASGMHPTGIVAALSTALLDEVLLRLFLMTGVAWLLLREFQVSAGRAAALAIGVTALAQGLIYLPGVLQIGFPNPVTALGFLTVTALVPAIAFGWLFWKRGFGTALVAHATALGALILITG
ncbi:MAG: hypothetical protein R6U63_05975 [Longimicrobiales bacterium]